MSPLTSVPVMMFRSLRKINIFTMVAKSTFFVSFKSHFMLLIFARFLVLDASQEHIQAGEEWNSDCDVVPWLGGVERNRGCERSTGSSASRTKNRGSICIT